MPEHEAQGEDLIGRPRLRGLAHFSHAATSVRTPLARHCAHRCLRIKISWSLRVQYGIVVQVHVRRFQTSRTAFIVMLYCAASADDLLSPGVREAFAR